MSSVLLDSYKQGSNEYKIASECYEYGFENGKKEIIDEIHKIYCTHKLTDEEVIEQIKMVLNREILSRQK